MKNENLNGSIKNEPENISTEGDKVPQASSIDRHQTTFSSFSQSNKEWREYGAGAGAAFVSTAFTFPINKTMFRQQIQNITATAAVRQLYSEGLIHLYRGVASPLIMRVACQSVMWGSYSKYSRIARENKISPTLAKFVGAIAAGATEASLMPLERVQVLMQDSAYHSRFKNTPDAFFQLRKYGVTEYYRGFTAILLRNCPGNVVFFFSRERLNEVLPKSVKEDTTSLNVSNFVSGAFLGAMISCAFYPVNVTKNHMQLVVGGPFLRFREVFQRLYEERGFKGMFRGVHVNYTRSFLSWGIINVTYENILKLLRHKEDQSGTEKVRSPQNEDDRVER